MAQDEGNEPDPMCECEHLESKHMIGARKGNGDYCLGKDYDDGMKMEVYCLCKKFQEEGSKPEPPAEGPAEPEKSSGGKPWEE